MAEQILREVPSTINRDEIRFGTDGFWPIVRSDDWCMSGVKRKEAAQ